MQDHPENGHHQQQSRCDKFNGLYAILEERKEELVGMISRQQDDKLDYVATETTWSARASLWGQPSSRWRSHRWPCSYRISATAKASNMERPEPGYESMAHFVTNTEDVADMLRTIDFNTSRASGSHREDGYDLDEGARTWHHCNGGRRLWEIPVVEKDPSANVCVTNPDLELQLLL
ncbi:tripartite motif-containing protein 54-like [Oncorhynchus tshawytscha]|uniref:tripartite motif-containing protein 54-like n=1 Tax=Oncorhynchus tshawytscha TaxID=74940 RepID=UPI000D0A6373|nr:tripartite motif-containing protein 54-like [Oncorhynchus tshawytscha]